uniref:Quaking_NLS domain-containing protein n=1 Tax=Ascaris lumbricoides TaxID=6252 RepID=A0A0M3IG44_ASCLU
MVLYRRQHCSIHRVFLHPFYRLQQRLLPIRQKQPLVLY